MPRGRRASVLAVATAVAVAAGCTSAPDPAPSPTPSASPGEEDAAPSTGDRIAVVVPPATVVAPAEAAALAQAGRELAAAPPADVRDVRVVEAVNEAFARDLAELAVDDGYDVVCIVGVGSAELALELARARRETRFCTTDARIEGGPVNLVAVAIDPDVLVQAGAIAIGTAPAPIGLLLSPQVGDVDLLTAAFTAAVAPPVQPSPPPLPDTAASPPPPTPTPSPSPPGPTAPQPPFVTATAGSAGAGQVMAGEELAAERPSRALVLATPGGAEAAAAAAGTGALLVSVSDWSVDEEGEPPANLLVNLTVDWAQLLAAAITAARTADAPQVQLRGVDVLDAVAGQATGANPAAERTSAFLREADG